VSAAADGLAGAARFVFDSRAGFGHCSGFLDDRKIEKIWVNQPAKAFVARDGLSELTTTVLAHGEVGDLVERICSGPPAAAFTCRYCGFDRRLDKLSYINCCPATTLERSK